MTKEDYLKMKQELSSLNKKQWSKKRQLKQVIEHISFMQKRINKNSVMSPEGHIGALYVPWSAVRYLPSAYRSLSSIQKQLNKGKSKIRYLTRRIKVEQINYLTKVTL